ncbi:hypothetical protein DR980_06350 [Flavobacterium psychrolimnae]|uniref:Uncharacterized protein n=1 Tax=Flavobacterium psychrolimnae TaxID=249351 RepID=A0A366B436_9FLAO|nr:hypothetical protein DR980_06350 [Flavobacterium psychrolimnae]
MRIIFIKKVLSRKGTKMLRFSNNQISNSAIKLFFWSNFQLSVAIFLSAEKAHKKDFHFHLG